MSFKALLTPLLRGYLRLIFRVKVNGSIPKDGAYILCANHTSLYDPVVVGAFSRRSLSFMAKAELFKIFGLGFLIKHLGAFPVDRNKADIKAIKTALSILKNGDALLMFPEGKRVKSGESSDAKSGMIMLAHKTGASIVPVGINSDYKLFSKLTVTFGEAVSLSEYSGKRLSSEEMDALAQDVLSKIKSLAGADGE